MNTNKTPETPVDPDDRLLGIWWFAGASTYPVGLIIAAYFAKIVSGKACLIMIVLSLAILAGLAAGLDAVDATQWTPITKTTFTVLATIVYFGWAHVIFWLGYRARYWSTAAKYVWLALLIFQLAYLCFGIFMIWQMYVIMHGMHEYQVI